MRIETNHTQGENWWENAKAGGGDGLKPREGEDGRDDVRSLMLVLKGRGSGKTVTRLFKNNSVPSSFRGITGTDDEALRFRTQVLEIMEELEEAASKTDLADRKKDDNKEWKKIQNRVADIGLDADAWAAAFDLAREQEAKDAAVLATAPDTKAGATKIEREDGLVDPVDIYYKERLLNDLNCVLTRGQGFDEARRRLISAGVRFDKITGVGRDEKENRKIRDTRNALRDVVGDLVQIVDNPTRADEVRVGYLPQLEHLVGLDRERFLKVRGLQKTKEEAVESVEGEENTPEDEVKRILAANTVDNQILNSVRSDLSRFIRSHDGDLKYSKAVEGAKRILLDLQERRHSQNAYRLTDEEMTRYGIEKPSNRDDLLLRTISKPILGHEILDDMTGGFLFRGEKRRAFEKEEIFSYAEIAEMLAEKYSELLESFNGQITNKSDVNPNWLGLVDERLRKRRDDLRKMIRTASVGEKGKIFFPSLLHSEKDVELGLDVLRQKIMDSGYPSLTSGERKIIPEVVALGEIEALLAWNDAQTELIRSLQTIRNYGNAKKVEGVAGLGENPDRLIMKTSSFRRLCQLNGIERDKEDRREEETIADMMDKTMRVYGLIASVAVEVPGKETGDSTDLFIKRLVRDFLTESEVIESGDARPKDVRYVLNRFAISLKPVQQARVEAFIRTLVQENVFGQLSIQKPRNDQLIFEKTIREKLVREIKLAKEIAERGSQLGTETEVLTLSRRDREIALAMGNGLALLHVTGEADSWSGVYEWKDPNPEKNHPSMKKSSYYGREMVAQMKVGGYPACTAGAEVANYSAKLIAELHENKWSSSSVLKDALERGLLPPYLANNYFRSTTIARGTEISTLEREWLVNRKTLRQIASDMGGVSEEAIQSYFNSLSWASKLAELLKGNDPNILKELGDNQKGQNRIQNAIDFGFGMPFGKERDTYAAELVADIYAGNIVFQQGMSGQLSSSEVIDRIEDVRSGADFERDLEKILGIVISDFVRTSPQVKGLNNSTLQKLKLKLPGAVNGSMSEPSMIKFVKIVEEYYSKTRKRRVAGDGGVGEAWGFISGARPVLIDVFSGDIPTKVLPFATIWNAYLRSI